MIELALRVAAAPHWYWMPGMQVLIVDERLRIAAERRLRVGVTTHRLVEAYGPRFRAAPDLGDPATLGCAREILARAWGDREPEVVRSFFTRPPETWKVEYWDAPPQVQRIRTVLLYAPSENVALAEAILLAPALQRVEPAPHFVVDD